jgi:hypothetical protein
MVRFSDVVSISHWLAIDLSTYINFLARVLIVVDLALVHEPIGVIELLLRPNRQMRVHRTPAIVARKDGVEIHRAPRRSGLRAGEPVRISIWCPVPYLPRIDARSVGLPDVYAGTCKRLASRDVDDLQSQALVDALLVFADVLAVRLAVGEEWSPNALGGKNAYCRIHVLVRIVPIESEELVVILVVRAFTVGGLVVINIVPLLESCFVCGESASTCDGPAWDSLTARLNIDTTGLA